MLEGFHYQNAYVTRDIDKWVGVFEAKAKVDRIVRFEGRTRVATPEGMREHGSKLAFIWVGDFQYELIQPLENSVPLFRDALPADDGLAFHHICMRVPEWAEFRVRLGEQEHPVVLEGGTGLSFAYIDTRSFLGHYVEYTCMTDGVWEQMGGPPMTGRW